MLKIILDAKNKRPLKILCIGAHSDDIEIGCGGTILWLLSQYNVSKVVWLVLGSNGKRDEEAVISAKGFLLAAKTQNIIIKNFKDGFFPYMGKEIKTFFEKLKMRESPDIIFTHYRKDLHQDHRMISELTWNTFRDHLILEYEICKYDGDLGAPNLFVHLDDEICRQKVRIIMESFKTQRKKDWFTEDVFYSLLRIRGIESRAPKRYAEGFYCRKIVIG